MADTLTPEARSARMAKIKGRNTRPEMIVRRELTAMGVRYRLHRRDLPGTPDIAFIGRRRVIFVNGCWWHGHMCRLGDRPPKSNQAFWAEKIARNVARDSAALDRLTAEGWLALTVWECEVRSIETLRGKLHRFLFEAQ